MPLSDRRPGRVYNAGKVDAVQRALTTGGVLAQVSNAVRDADVTLRQLRLPHGARRSCPTRVGFISDLPTMLVAAFRATLEEVIEADVILRSY